MTDFEKYSVEDIQRFLEETVHALLRAGQQGNSEEEFRASLSSHLSRFGEVSPEQQAYIVSVLAQMLFDAKRPSLALAGLRFLESLRLNCTVDQLVDILELAGPLCCELVESADLADAASVARSIVTILPAGLDEGLDNLSGEILELISMASVNALNLRRRTEHRDQALRTIECIETRYGNSPFVGAQSVAAAARLNHGYLSLLSDTHEARHYFQKALRLSTHRVATNAQSERLSEIAGLAKHCLLVMEALEEIPPPLVNLEYQNARDTETRRLRMQWLTELPRALFSKSRRQQHFAIRRMNFSFSTRSAARAAARVTLMHTRSIRSSMFWACQGDPFVLYLRNFDTSDSTQTKLEGVTHTAMYRYPSFRDGVARSGDALHEQLVSAGVPVLEVANSRGDLDLDRPGYRVYLNDEDWHNHVARLITMAEVIVMKSVHVSEGVLAELDLIRMLKRSSDTIVVIPTDVEARDFLDGLDLRNRMSHVFAKYPTEGWKRMRQKASLDKMVDLTFPEIFTARHPMLQDADFMIVEGLGDKFGDGDVVAAPVASVASSIAARFSSIVQKAPRERLVAYSKRIADAFASQELASAIAHGPAVSYGLGRSAESDQPGIEITEAAVATIESLMRAEDRLRSGFRVSVVPGKTGGFRYRLDFDNRIMEGDLRRDYENFTLLVDRQSAPYLVGAILDYVDTVEKEGFAIDNPNVRPVDPSSS